MPPTGTGARALEETENALVRHARTRNAGDLALLVQEYEAYALSLAHRMHRDREPLEDLEQIAREALVVALRRFDPGRGLPFPAFATPTILGALRRYYRDHGWSVRVPRRVHELTVRARTTSEQLTARIGRSPTLAEVACAMAVSVDDLLAAQEAAHARNTAPIDLTSAAAVDDAALTGLENRLALRQAMAELDGRDRQVLELYFFQELSQREIAARFGVSQMQVSRWTASIVRRLRDRLVAA